jgi:hypothetical protein
VAVALEAVEHFLRSSVHLRDGDRVIVRQLIADLGGNGEVKSGGRGGGLSTAQAAEVLGLTKRQVRNLAAALGGYQEPNGHWLFDSRAVAAEKERREARE